ncbi:MAG TPA: F0F1 ATP synthase subunit A [Candidatus Fimimorpha faecalis]|uniref:ATP synthase subunit a n=1 Tax=Candidatus Fimimorpha faecalis TaxID=2840824 RepID=A0A9D1EDA7_9FIRM|nr:F0F1 ATP synthase subunit A [Candidatus Fimimorpha faecalis]
MEELNCKTVFTIPIFGGLDISESTVITWFIIAFVAVLCMILVRNLSVESPSKKQQVLELAVGGLYNIFDGLLGKAGRRYIPYLMSVLIYLGISNVIGILGVKPPTKDMNVTAALALMSIILIEYAGIHAKGGRGFIKSFAQPMAIMTPINILEVFIRPLSLCMRLFGNILGGFVVMELIKYFVPAIIPIPFSFYFDIFDGLIQAYVFVFLTSLFIKESIE